MSGLNWNIDNISELGKIFLRKVMENMRGYDGSTVWFGETGKGIQPNYQVRFPKGLILTISGASHKQFPNAEKFNDARISQPFTLADIKQAYESS